MASRIRSESESSDTHGITCVVCCQRVPGQNRRPIFAVGVCDHIVCYECSTKLRVLCKQNECPICRRDLHKVIYTFDRNYKYNEEDTEKCVYFNNEYKVYFQNELVLEAYEKLLENKCCICKLTFKDLASFEKHLHKEHNLFLCELCVEQLKIFSHERKYYSKRDLYRHKKTGDADDKSHRGHPMCTFCETRFFDEDFLHRHLRRDHYYCHICDPGGLNKFFGTYPTLRDHFKSRHFLCEEGSCAEEQFTTVFKSEIDLQAHKAKTHCHTKSELKSARTLALDLLIKPQRHRPQASQSAHSLSVASVQKRNLNGNVNSVEQGSELLGEAAAIPQTLPQPEDFPELSASKTSNLFLSNDVSTKKAETKKNTFSARVGGAIGAFASRNEEEFPALSSVVASYTPPKAAFSTKRSMSSVAAAFAMKPMTSKATNVPLSMSHTEPFSAINVINYCDHTNSSTLRNSKDFSVTTDDFPALPMKQTKTKSRRKKKSAVNGKVSEVEQSKSIDVTAKKSSEVSESRKELVSDDFPALTKTRTQIASESRSPPGLSKALESPASMLTGSSNSSHQTHPPPPGYSKKSHSKKPAFEISLLTVAQQVITKGKVDEKESKSRKEANYVYMQPLDFNERNQALVQEVSHLLRDKFNVFKQISKDFRQGEICGDDYWKKCLNIFGNSNFSKVFGELLVLLPDIRKQNELLSLYENYQKQTKGAIPKRTSSNDGLCIVKPDHAMDFVVCPVCQQILAKRDSSHHMTLH